MEHLKEGLDVWRASCTVLLNRDCFLQCCKEADPLEVDKDDLAELLNPFQRLFSGELEKHEGKKFHLKVEADSHRNR